MSTMIKKAMLAGLVGLSLVACGKKDEGAAGGAGGAGAAGSASTTSAAVRAGSCQKLANAGKCNEYVIKSDADIELNKGPCEATHGTWVMTACPTEKQFGNCVTGDSKIFFYAGTQAPDALLTMDEEFAKVDCELTSGKLTLNPKSKPAAPAAANPAAPVKKAGPAPAAAPKPKK